MKKLIQLSFFLILLFNHSLLSQEPGMVIELGSTNTFDVDNFNASGGYLQVGSRDNFNSYLSLDNSGIQSIYSEGGKFTSWLQLNPFGGLVFVGDDLYVENDAIINGQLHAEGANIQGNIIADGDVIISSVDVINGRAVCFDDQGKIENYEPNFTSFNNLNTGESTVPFTTWTPVGPPKTFTKEFDCTIIDAQLNDSVYWSGADARTIRLRVQILNENLSASIGGQSSNAVTWEHVTSHTIYKNLPAGTYTAQVFARSIGGTAQVSLRSDVQGGGMWIEERL